MPTKDWDKLEFYYQTDTGKYIKLPPITSLSLEEINIRQEEIHSPLPIDITSLESITATIENADLFMDELADLQKSLIRQEIVDRELWTICEMAKRYIYLLKEKSK